MRFQKYFMCRSACKGCAFLNSGKGRLSENNSAPGVFKLGTQFFMVKALFF